jgi:hypothetical protein
VATAIGSKLGTEVSVGRVDMGFLNRLIIDDVTILDQRQTPMISARRMAVKMDLLPLLEGRVRISSAQLFGAQATFYRDSAGATPNYQFALDALSSDNDDNPSALDLRIGSPEAAKLLGAKLHSSTYDGTKQHYFAIARLSKPYFGCQTLSLNFYGEEKALGSVHLSNLKLPLDDCRKNVLDIAADISQRFGVKMEPATDETPEEALKRHERWRSSTDNSQYRISFIDCHTRMDNGQKTVSYEVEGMVDSQTKELSAELSIRAEDK